MVWYESLPSEKQDVITKLAMKRRKQVVEEYMEDEKKRSEKRQEAMKQSHRRRQALRAKALNTFSIIPYCNCS